MGKEERSKANSDLKKQHTVRKSSRLDEVNKKKDFRTKYERLLEHGIDTCASDIMKQLNMAKQTIRQLLPLDVPREQIEELHTALNLDNRLTCEILPSCVDKIQALLHTAKRLHRVYNTSFTAYAYATGTLLRQVHELLDPRRIVTENCQEEVLQRVRHFLLDSIPLPKPSRTGDKKTKSHSKGSTRHKRTKRKNTRRNKTSH